MRKDNKTRGGKCLAIAGSAGMWGAAILTATAAARMGAGYVYLLTEKRFPVFKHPDFLVYTKQEIEFRAIALGPGLKSQSHIKKWIKKLIKEKHPSVVLDAEALNTIAKMKVILPATWILTPHEGELARLLKVPSATIRKNRMHYVQLAQEKYKCIVLLKGNQTLIADNRCVFTIPVGNSSLAKAGTGDVLTGMILGLLSQNVTPINAAATAAFVHGQIADDWIKGGKDVLSLMASDLVAALPEALSRLRKSI